MIFTVPNVRFYIPGVLVNQLFDLTQYRILSLAILAPVVLAIWSDNAGGTRRGFRWTDALLATFLTLQVVLLVPYESTTNTMRRTFLFTIDTFLVLYAFSRLTDARKIADVMACFWLCCANHGSDRRVRGCQGLASLHRPCRHLGRSECVCVADAWRHVASTGSGRPLHPTRLLAGGRPRPFHVFAPFRTAGVLLLDHLRSVP